jgi:hypothetical protein
MDLKVYYPVQNSLKNLIFFGTWTTDFLLQREAVLVEANKRILHCSLQKIGCKWCRIKLV